ncbi:hypothetical protein C8J57DRAFT_1259255 [Mycena rebaudengoi]|nr:hypothetical protein C8J57DRAFT_1259255 [Mycena rebaudengoi]
MLPLDESLYDRFASDSESLAFIKSHTGIEDPDALREHIIDVQRKAYEVGSHLNLFRFPCIRSFSFARVKITEGLAYQCVVDLGRQREGAIFLDLGCCPPRPVGVDVRKLVSDGFPVQNVIATDICGEFWQQGHELFKSTPATFPAAFVAGDLFDNDFIQPVGPCTSPPPSARPSLDSLANLTPLNGHVSAMNASRLFHLFDEPTQLALARVLAGLLSPLPGSVIFGEQAGKEQEGNIEWTYKQYSGKMFCHSPESWTKLWLELFPDGTVQVEAKLNKNDPNYVSNKADPDRDNMMWWSVTRL